MSDHERQYLRKLLKEYCEHPFLSDVFFLSQNAEVIIRVLVSAVAAIFLLAPMFALSYIDRKGYRLLTTALFVLCFAVVVPVSSTAKNQEIIVAIAAYAAVLVVFVGQTQAG
jgi:hypothetical protein